jgi:ankyrin repeat protein
MDLEDLLDAVEDGDEALVKKALDSHKVNINGVDEEGFSPLMLAAHCGRDSMVELLVTRKADVNYTAGDGSDALLCAVQGGYDDSVQVLLDSKSQVNARKPDDYSPLYSAVQEGHTRLVRKLIKAGAEVDAKCHGVAPLFIAAQENHLGVVEALLTASCDVNVANASRATPLFIAVQKGNTTIVESLVKRGKKKHLNLEVCTKQGLTPLLAAIKLGHLDEAKLLIVGGADVQSPSELDGNTPLITAALYGDIDLVEELVAAGADVDARNDAGEDAATILHREFGEDLHKIVEEHGSRQKNHRPHLHRQHNTTTADRADADGKVKKKVRVLRASLSRACWRN